MSASILLIDNYDSFVYNLSRYFTELGCRTEVLRNDAATVEQIRQRNPAAIVLSPGPCTPKQAGVCVELVRHLAEEIPILGVCLGHQAIAEALGGRVVRSEDPVHGQTTQVEHDGRGVFEGLPDPLIATRYHSLIVEESSLPDSLAITARTAEGLVMGLAHRKLPIAGVQFHPESILTDCGHRLLANFLAVAGVEANIPVTSDHAFTSESVADFFQQPIDYGPPQPDRF